MMRLLDIAVNFQQFRKESRNVKEELCLNVIIHFHYCLLTCRNVMFQKQYFEYTEMGATSSR